MQSSLFPNIKTANVLLVWEPQCGMDMKPDQARLELGSMSPRQLLPAKTNSSRSDSGTKAWRD